MEFNVKFLENEQHFDAKFGEVYNVSDGGYERGYAAGYETGNAEGYTKGHAEGVEDGYATGYEEGVKSVPDYLDMALANALTAYTSKTATIIKGFTFRLATALEYVDFHKAERLQTYVFYGCTNLKTLIIRTSTLCTLDALNTFTNTPIDLGTGVIYVPDNLVEQYKTAKNWSTYASQIRAIEDYPEITEE